MNENHAGSTPEEDGMLHRLIRNARSEEASIRPDREAITSYLMGIASNKEKEVMQAALARSAAFRREVLEMANDIEELAGADSLGSKKKDVHIAAPGLAGFLGMHAKSESGGRERESLWAKIKRWRLLQVYVPAAAAVTALMLILAQTGVFGPGRPPDLAIVEWRPEIAQVDAGWLIQMTPRAPTGAETHETYETPSEAALAEFAAMLDYRDGSFHLRPQEEPSPPPLFKAFVLKIVDDGGGTVREITFKMPDKEAGFPGASFWALSLPSRNLSSLAVSSDTTLVLWSQDLADSGAITLVYSRGDRYSTLPGSGFRR